MNKKRYFDCMSSREYFTNEATDVKNNTSRFTDDWGKEKWACFKNATHIRITVVDGTAVFNRKIRHRCTYKNLAIITWYPII